MFANPFFPNTGSGNQFTDHYCTLPSKNKENNRISRKCVYQPSALAFPHLRAKITRTTPFLRARSPSIFPCAHGFVVLSFSFLFCKCMLLQGSKNKDMLPRSLFWVGIIKHEKSSWLFRSRYFHNNGSKLLEAIVYFSSLVMFYCN